MSSNEVVATGIGVLSGPSEGAEAFWQQISAPAPEQPTNQAIVGFDGRRWLDRRQAQRTDPYAQLAVAAAALAKEDAGLGEIEPGRTGVVLGVALGPLSITEEHGRFLEGGAEHVSALMPVRTLPNANAAVVGRAGSASTGSSPSRAAAPRARTPSAKAPIERGACDVVLAGASEAGIPADGKGALEFLRAGLSTPPGHHRRARGPPLRRGPQGLRARRRAAVVVLESAAHAEARGAVPYGRIAACANVLDGDLVAPDPSVATPSPWPSSEPSTRPGLAPMDVVQVNAHGSGTMANDLAESRAVHVVFGEPGPPVLSIKGVTGHSGAGAGSLEAVAVLLSMRHGLLPPTHGVRTVDEGLGLDVVHGEARPWEPGPSISLSLGLGGHVGCLVILPRPDARRVFWFWWVKLTPEGDFHPPEQGVGQVAAGCCWAWMREAPPP